MKRLGLFDVDEYSLCEILTDSSDTDPWCAKTDYVGSCAGSLGGPRAQRY